MKLAVLFPGQGSQYIGMGKEFVEQYQECEELMELADSVCDFPLKTICFEGPIEELTRAAIVQPALTATNLICLKALQLHLPPSLEIACYAGHSAGEYSALCAASVISPEDAIRLVERRGYYMEREGRKNPGGMRAILGLDIEEVEALVEGYSGNGVVAIANYNTEKQIVISGSFEAIDAVSSVAEEKGGKAIALKVSVANHSPLVADAVPDFYNFLEEVEFSPPQTPVYFNVCGHVEKKINDIKHMMAHQIATRVRWYEIINRMLADGVDTFLEVGPKAVLKGMMRKIVPKGVEVTSLQFDSPDLLENCLGKIKIA
jgi:[acyl-carrier-protein] S-malonyltransferase